MPRDVLVPCRLEIDAASSGGCRLRRQDAEANGEAGPKGVSQEAARQVDAGSVEAFV